MLEMLNHSQACYLGNKPCMAEERCCERKKRWGAHRGALTLLKWYVTLKNHLSNCTSSKHNTHSNRTVISKQLTHHHTETTKWEAVIRYTCHWQGEMSMVREASKSISKWWQIYMFMYICDNRKILRWGKNNQTQPGTKTALDISFGWEKSFWRIYWGKARIMLCLWRGLRESVV